jgi:hypothetical protein
MLLEFWIILQLFHLQKFHSSWNTIVVFAIAEDVFVNILVKKIHYIMSWYIIILVI